MCESLVPITTQSNNFIYSAIETQYYTGSLLDLLEFSDINNVIYQTYQLVNTKNTCPQGFSLVANSCYRLINDYLYDWTQAQGSCVSFGSQLASFDNQTELALVRSWLNKMIIIRENIWTDGRLINGVWVWNTNKIAVSSDLLNNINANSQIDSLDLNYSNGFILTNDVASSNRTNYVLCKSSAYVFNKNTVLLKLINKTTAVTSTGQPVIGFTYQKNITEIKNLINVNQPTASNYSSVYSANPIQYGQYYLGKVYPYSTPFQITLCNQIPGGQIDNIQFLIYKYWTNAFLQLASCNCFNVFIISAIPYVDTNNSTSTMINFIAKANDTIFDATTTNSAYVPSISSFYNVLASNGYSQCVPRVARSATLQLAAQSYISPDAVQQSINTIRPDLAGKVEVARIAQTNGINVNTNQSVSVNSFDVSINGKSLNFLTQTDIDPTRLIEQINYQNPGTVITLSTGIYSRSYFFTLFSNTRISVNKYSQLTAAISSVFLKNYPQFAQANVSVTIPLQEEYIDLNQNLFYGLNILITINEQLADDVISINRTIFNQIQSIQSSNNVVYTFFTPKGYVLPLNEAITFFSNMAITQDNKPKLEALIQKILTTTFPNYAGALSVILATQKPQVNINGTKFWKLFIIPHISNTNIILTLTQDLKEFVSTVSSSANFVHPSGNAYKFNVTMPNVYDLSMQFSVVIKGMVAEYDSDIIRNAISSTWVLTAQQNLQLSSQWAQGMYQLQFIDDYIELVDKNYQYYTKYIYFIEKNNVLVHPDDLPTVPNYQWIQSLVASNNLSYTIVDPNVSKLTDYSTFYYVDLLGFIDFTYYNDISNIVKSVFTQYYTGNF